MVSRMKQNEEIKRASISTGSDVVSMCIVPVRVKKKDSINKVSVSKLRNNKLVCC